jgi:GGDEF domain-containing protein
VAVAENAVLQHRDGRSIAIQDSAAPIQDRSGQVIGAVMVFHDVSQERQLHRKLSYYASHDSLTGFINRREFEERLAAAVRDVQHANASPYALLYLDLDQFKVVNDTCGHAAGDLLLRQLSEILKARHRTAGEQLAALGSSVAALKERRHIVDLAHELELDVSRRSIGIDGHPRGDGLTQRAPLGA